MWSYLLRCRLQKRPHLLKKKKKKKKNLPTLPNFFGVVTLNTHIFYLALLNMRNTLKQKLAELTYAEITHGRESTRLPHTHKFTSLKNIVISAPHKTDKRIQATLFISKSRGPDKILRVFSSLR